MNKCPFCESEKIIEFNETEYFQYGADPDGIVLSAPIVVEFCNSCDEKWTDWRSEDSRQKAVETHLATKGQQVPGGILVEVDAGSLAHKIGLKTPLVKGGVQCPAREFEQKCGSTTIILPQPVFNYNVWLHFSSLCYQMG